VTTERSGDRWRTIKLDLSPEEVAVLLPVALQIGEHIQRMQKSRDVKDRAPDEVRDQMKAAIDAALMRRGLLGLGHVGWACDGSTVKVWLEVNEGEGDPAAP
jgi:hypothetical protein